MSKYTDLLENRRELKAMKESMFKLGYSNDKLQLLTDKINQLSMEIRSLEPDETPTIMLDDVNFLKKPKILPLAYEDFIEFYKDYIINSINNRLNAINVPIGVYAIFRNTVVKSEDYIMKHHYNIYYNDVELRNKWIIHK